MYIDLGAHHGDSYGSFIGSSDTDGKNGIFSRMFAGSTITERNSCHVHLLEGNTMFKPYLEEARRKSFIPDNVFLYVPSLIYGIDTELSFYINPGSGNKPGCRNCGGALDPQHSSSKNSGIVKKTQTININRLLYENTIPDDHVIIKSNIEGGEWPIIPCISKSNSRYLIDELWVEVHTIDVAPTLAFGPETTEYSKLRHDMKIIENSGVEIHEFGASCLTKGTFSEWCLK